MKNEKRLTRKERQAKNGVGPAQAWFPKGKPFLFAGPDKPTVRKPTDKAPKLRHTNRLQCTLCGPAKFKTVSKATKTIKCRKCGKKTVVTTTTCGALGQPQ